MKKKLKMLAGAVLACASLQVNAADQIPLPANFSLLALSGGVLNPFTAISGQILGSIIPAAAPVFVVVSGLTIPGFAVINGLAAPVTGPNGLLPALALPALPGLSQ
jgi:hypothetical protein